MELGKACRSRKEVKEGIVNLEAKRTRLAEMVKDKSNELQPTWLKTILVQMQQMTVKSGGLYWPDPDANTYNDIRHKNNKSK